MSERKDIYNIALIGNPNVGKSTLFNALTGMKQHTGNWTGKTVGVAQGGFVYEEVKFVITDLPGSYSLLDNWAEEGVTSDFLLSKSQTDCVVAVVDGQTLSRSLALVLELCESVKKVIVCVNLIDEAKKKGIVIDLDELSLQTGAETIGVCAKDKKDVDKLRKLIFSTCRQEKLMPRKKTALPKEVEEAQEMFTQGKNLPRLKALREICNSGDMADDLYEAVQTAYYQRAESISALCVRSVKKDGDKSDRLLDRIFTSRLTAFPLMAIMLAVIFLITILLANYPSRLLSALFIQLEKPLASAVSCLGAPLWLKGLLLDGIYRTLSWVVAVMLPPMAIFLPLFTILEDFGLLPRIAFNLDRCFYKSGAHGKQALTMCLGFCTCNIKALYAHRD